MHKQAWHVDSTDDYLISKLNNMVWDSRYLDLEVIVYQKSYLKSKPMKYPEQQEQMKPLLSLHRQK